MPALGRGPEGMARAGRTDFCARASREPRVGRALCCIIAPAGRGVGTPGTLGGHRGSGDGLAFRLVSITRLSPSAWPPCFLSAGAGPTGSRRPVALRGRAGAGGGGFELSAFSCLRPAAAVSPHRPGKLWGPGFAGFGRCAQLPNRSGVKDHVDSRRPSPSGLGAQTWSNCPSLWGMEGEARTFVVPTHWSSCNRAYCLFAHPSNIALNLEEKQHLSFIIPVIQGNNPTHEFA